MMKICITKKLKLAILLILFLITGCTITADVYLLNNTNSQINVFLQGDFKPKKEDEKSKKKTVISSREIKKVISKIYLLSEGNKIEVSNNIEKSCYTIKKDFPRPEMKGFIAKTRVYQLQLDADDKLYVLPHKYDYPLKITDNNKDSFYYLEKEKCPTKSFDHD